MKKPTKKQEIELVSAVGILPVLADFLEDLHFQREMKMKVNQLISQIRSFDNFIMRTAPAEVVEEQHNVALWFRNEINKFINEGQDSK